MSDQLSDLVKEAFNATCEAEKIAHAGPKGAVYRDLLEAHSALLRARNQLLADARAARHATDA